MHKESLPKKTKEKILKAYANLGEDQVAKVVFLNIILAASCPVQYTGDYTARVVI